MIMATKRLEIDDEWSPLSSSIECRKQTLQNIKFDLRRDVKDDDKKPVTRWFCREHCLLDLPLRKGDARLLLTFRHNWVVYRPDPKGYHLIDGEMAGWLMVQAGYVQMNDIGELFFNGAPEGFSSEDMAVVERAIRASEA